MHFLRIKKKCWHLKDFIMTQQSGLEFRIEDIGIMEEPRDLIKERADNFKIGATGMTHIEEISHLLTSKDKKSLKEFDNINIKKVSALFCNKSLYLYISKFY
ncbi:unnamed protein product [Blepharisma stoltei]|uniref:Uncharacterized protein n=1 Tax=Blepharisma stoltei TaxID=1481888 RepID=A0AAU9J5G5_9CILI|nr:unnamed protein product [Blepharisma stoltei]